MSPHNQHLYDRISRLRAEALDALSALTRDGLVLPGADNGNLVHAMQTAGNQLGIAVTLLGSAGALALAA